MIKIQSTHHSGDNFVRVAWDVTEFCEKRCHYCVSYRWLKSLKAKDVEFDIPPERIELDDHMAKLIPQIMTEGDICFFGGEPTLHPKGIEYFNQMCRDTTKDTNILFATHGDIDEEKIRSFDPGNKENYMICVSYHYYQVKFEQWLEKVKIFQECIPNVYVSGLIPPQKKIWDQYRENINKIMDLGIRFELKPQLDPVLGEPDLGVIHYWKEDMAKAEKTFPRLVDNQTYGILLDDGNQKLRVPNAKFTPQIPLIAGQSLCQTKQFNLINGKFERACSLGDSIEIKTDTTVDELKNFVNNTKMMCPINACRDSSNITTNIAVMGADLSSPRFAEYAACEFTEQQ
jgi:organic radical activating enzyme